MVFPVARAGPIFQLTIDCIVESSVKILSKETGDRDKPKGSSKEQFGPIAGKKDSAPQVSTLDNGGENANHNAVRFVPCVSKFGLSGLKKSERTA